MTNVTPRIDAIGIKHINPAALHVMWVMKEAGFETRLCGGAVRDLVRQCTPHVVGQEPKDWDLATTARPEQVIEIMNKWDIHVIPTGLDHGTVTAMIEDEPIEITTLRVDVATDGRHAEVAFTDDWYEDSMRRDFTMNAMYIDADGVLHDYHNGQRDIHDSLVAFVGNAEDRIKEDYLRIMRWFRFHSRVSTSHRGANDDVLVVIARHAEGLRQISGERIWSELKKILDVPFVSSGAVSMMKSAGVLDQIGLSFIRDPQKLAASQRLIEDGYAVHLAAATPADQHPVLLKTLKDRFHASREETLSFEFAINKRDIELTRANALKLLGKYKKRDVLAWIQVRYDIHVTTHGYNGSDTETLGGIYNSIRDIEVPDFPISGKDLMDLGFKPGPDMGRVLSELRDEWALSEFTANRSMLLEKVHLSGGVLT